MFKTLETVHLFYKIKLFFFLRRQDSLVYIKMFVSKLQRSTKVYLKKVFKHFIYVYFYYTDLNKQNLN